MEFNDSQAIYLQIADLFCENILLEEWKPGDRIPSVREMAVNMEVNPNTVMRTFNYLQDREIIFNKRGIGYFVADDGYEKTKSLMQKEFVRKELPAIFKKMNVLNLTISDLNHYYEEFMSTEPIKRKNKT